ncbi:MAG: hypothetical protein GXP16_06070 [Gammaproteobacteria bacterium]|nr:hypothetical protein [Gammaproteobacteria bacterium]
MLIFFCLIDSIHYQRCWREVIFVAIIIASRIDVLFVVLGCGASNSQPNAEEAWPR